MSKLNGTLQGKFLFQKQVFEMRVPLGKLTVVDTPSLGNERAKRGLATSRCLSPALRGSTSASTLSFIICLSPNFYVPKFLQIFI
ncbi:MAG: hypothetical protein DRJ14_06380 [Acidobacteria bacterium]|nr:MAG: hypothetical protein DRJ14_06380 [Acidobacteriota bacterium]